MFVGMGANSGGGYNLESSLRFRSSASAYLSRTPASATNRQTWTWSGWVKRGNLSTSQVLFGVYDNSSTSDTNFFSIKFTTSGELACDTYSVDYRISSAIYRDPSAWYHIVVAVDTTQATANNRIKMYLNGNEITSFSTINNPALNASTAANSTIQHRLGSVNLTAAPKYFDGYMTEVNFVDGQALTPSDFGEYDTITGVWKPKRYTGTYGTNGFYLNFSDSTSTTTLGYDQSSNSNNWTLNNISLTAGTTYDLMNDVPTLTDEDTANYCVLNPLDEWINTTGVIDDANLKFTTSSSNGIETAVTGSIGASSSSWYWEITVTQVAATTNCGIGILQGHSPSNVGTVNCWLAGYSSTTSLIIKNGASSQTGLSALSNGDIIGIAFDATNGTLQFYKNNSTYGSQVTGLTSGEYYPFVYGQTSSSGVRWILNANFGQRPFAYTPPTGFKKLNTYNLPDSTIVDGSQYMDATTYTGNGSTQTITNAGGFNPDLVWIKSRSSGVYNHILNDSIRGAGYTIYPNLTNAEAYGSVDITSFNSNGFSLGNGASVNASATTFVGWQWRGSDSSAVTNTDGTITSTVSANTTSGFSVMTYTGNGANATVGHGLGVAPKCFFIKARGASVNWTSYHEPLGNTAGLHLNTTGGSDVNSGFFNNTSPTSTTIAIGSGSTVNTNGGTYVAYCFAEVEGYSKFGPYTGNGSADGPFIYTGFRPAFVMAKQTNGTGSWIIIDSTRDIDNVSTQYLHPNLADAEGSTTLVDILSNGFKWRYTGQSGNASGGTYIYMAFAENPFKHSLAR